MMQIRFFIFFVITFVLFGTYAKASKLKWIQWLALTYFIFGVLLNGFLFLYEKILPFDNELITKGVIKREIVQHYRNRNKVLSYYIYSVHRKEYEGKFHKENKWIKQYSIGDTINVTYSKNDPGISVATFTQYWYINSDKEKYWIKIKKGEGRKHLTLQDTWKVGL